MPVPRSNKPRWKWLALQVGGKVGKAKRMAIMRTQAEPGTDGLAVLKYGKDTFDIPEITQLLDRRKARWEEMRLRKSIRPFFTNRKAVAIATRDVGVTIHHAATQYPLIGQFLQRWKYIYVDKTGALVGTNWNIPLLPRHFRLETKKILEGKY